MNDAKTVTKSSKWIIIVWRAWQGRGVNNGVEWFRTSIALALHIQLMLSSHTDTALGT